MNNRLPSFHALRAFEATARHLSFLEASEELCVTQSAISHQVKVLEDFLECSLFERNPTGIKLTQQGAAYHAKVSVSIDGLKNATNEIKESHSSGTIYVESPPSFAANWIIPRLMSFNQVHPDINIVLTSNAATDNSKEYSCDVRITCGTTTPPGEDVEAFFSSPRAPVCRPELLEGSPPINHPKDILQYPILREISGDGWADWFKAAGFCSIPEIKGHYLDNVYLTTQAALDGQGIALSYIGVITDELELGHLVKIFDHTTTPELIFTIAFRKNWKRQTEIIAFREWLNTEIGAFSKLA